MYYMYYHYMYYYYYYYYYYIIMQYSLIATMDTYFVHLIVYIPFKMLYIDLI